MKLKELKEVPEVSLQRSTSVKCSLTHQTEPEALKQLSH